LEKTVQKFWNISSITEQISFVLHTFKDSETRPFQICVQRGKWYRVVWQITCFKNLTSFVEKRRFKGSSLLYFNKNDGVRTNDHMISKRLSIFILKPFVTWNVGSLLGKFLQREGYSFIRIDGNTPMHYRQRLVDIFSKSKTTFIFLISTKACGLGLNLSGKLTPLKDT
jgi:hypothetical protein